ncbi:MAG TPA: TIGR02147 family protein [Polyangiaceae bacterium]|nr:TIGR02147 family protein [Polyangiaceae bacterium]
MPSCAVHDTFSDVGTRASVDVFRYRDYRVFLREHYERNKTRKRGYSLRAFSLGAGLRSPNYLKLVMDGARNLTPQMAFRFAETCGLSGEAQEYFCDLVAFNQARLAKERELCYERLKRFSRFRKVHKLDAESEYHSEWYIPAIRELVSRRDFQDDPAWIAATLLPQISPAQARRALSVLLELGLLARDESGKLVQPEQLLETPEGPLGHHVVQFHRVMMAHGADALDRVPRTEREISSLTLCLSEAAFDKLKAEVAAFRSSLLQRYQADDDAERVVQLNFQLFPLSRRREI